MFRVLPAPCCNTLYHEEGTIEDIIKKQGPRSRAAIPVRFVHR